MPPSDDWIANLRQLTSGEQRLRVLAILAETGSPSYHEDIRDAFDARQWNYHPTGLSKVLRDLEKDGYILGDVPDARRHGRAIRYTLNRDRVRAVLDDALSTLGLD